LFAYGPRGVGLVVVVVVVVVVPAQRYASAVSAMALCLSVTSRLCIETDKWIELTQRLLSISPTVRYQEILISSK